MVEKIENFGRKIGGSRADLYSVGEWTESEVKSLTRSDIWRPIRKSDEPNDILRYIKQKIRLMVQKEPKFRTRCSEDEAREVAESYVAKIERVKKDVMEIKNITDLDNLIKNYRKEPFVFDIYGLRRADLDKIENSLADWIKSAVASAAKAHVKKERKEKFVPEQLKNLERIGPDWRKGRNTDADDWQGFLKFSAGEFGHWLNQNDRQTNLNMAFDALMDMAYVLNVTPESMSMCGRLAIAFGSRGIAHTFAHYEPRREVVALTKLRGAGSLAHEMFHAIDNIYPKEEWDEYNTMATEAFHADAFRTLVDTMRYQNQRITEFYKGSNAFAENFGGGYWNTAREMAARAFACYITDKLAEAGMKNDYLSGHSELDVSGDIKAIPEGEERKAINAAFDALFNFLKEKGFMKEASPKAFDFGKFVRTKIKIDNEEEGEEDTVKTGLAYSAPHEEAVFYETEGGQLSLFPAE